MAQMGRVAGQLSQLWRWRLLLLRGLLQAGESHKRHADS